MRPTRTLRPRGANLLLVALLAAATVVCGERNLRAQPVPHPLDGTIATAEGTAAPARFVSLSAKELVVAEPDGARRTLPIRDVRRFAFARRPPSVARDPSLVLLANGDRLRLRPSRTQDERLVAQWPEFPGWKPASIPLETIRGLVFDRPANPVAETRAFAAWFERRDPVDVVHLAGGDRVTGEFSSLTPDRIVLELAAGPTPILRSNARALSFNPELISFPVAKGPTVRLHLADGSRLTATSVESDGAEHLRVAAAYGEELRIPVAAVASFVLLGGRAVDVADLVPVEFKHVPVLEGEWPWQAHRNATGGPLRVRGASYDRGLGMRSGSVLAFDLAGRYRSFRANVGIDDAAGGRGNAEFVVLVDGKTLFESGAVDGRGALRSVGPLDVTGAKRLELRVDYGAGFDIADLADWCEAVLVE